MGPSVASFFFASSRASPCLHVHCGVGLRTRHRPGPVHSPPTRLARAAPRSRPIARCRGAVSATASWSPVCFLAVCLPSSTHTSFPPPVPSCPFQGVLPDCTQPPSSTVFCRPSKVEAVRPECLGGPAVSTPAAGPVWLSFAHVPTLRAPATSHCLPACVSICTACPLVSLRFRPSLSAPRLSMSDPLGHAFNRRADTVPPPAL